MYVRCTGCGGISSFRNQRGNKISHMKCDCRGNYERLSGTVVYDENPPEGVESFVQQYGPNAGKKYYAAWKNSKGIIFFIKDVNGKGAAQG